ncbi:MAG: rRNA methyltransferase [Acidobacteria bacterium]|nr:rRNA methyltransferase [Acidobacteriota bacterium]
MKLIGSRQNRWFKRLREAIRDHAQELVIEGPKPIGDATAGGWHPLARIVREGSSASATDLVFTAELFDSLTETKTTQGMLGLFERPTFTAEALFARRDTVIVALDAVQDPGNVGTIIRLAAAFDAAGVITLPGCADPFSPKSIRASVGAILTVPVLALSVSSLLLAARQAGFALYAADASGSSTTAPPPSRAVIVFGSEGQGVSPTLLAQAHAIAIATSARVESLNVATSAAILLHASFAGR